MYNYFNWWFAEESIETSKEVLYHLKIKLISNFSTVSPVIGVIETTND